MLKICLWSEIKNWLNDIEVLTGCSWRKGHLPRRVFRDGELVDKEMKKSKDGIPNEVLKEIFPKRFNRSLATKQIYIHLRQVILSGKLKKGQKLLQEKIAQDFRVSRVTVGIAFSQLKKDGLIISKRGTGSFIIWLLRNIYILQVHSGTYECLFFGQNGGDSLLQGRESSIPHLFNIHLWIE